MVMAMNNSHLILKLERADSVSAAPGAQNQIALLNLACKWKIERRRILLCKFWLPLTPLQAARGLGRRWGKLVAGCN